MTLLSTAEPDPALARAATTGANPPAPGQDLTRRMASWASTLPDTRITPAALEWAKHALLDWLAVTVAGRDEPLVRMLTDEFAADERASCTVIATGRRASPHDAALINGAAGHALDFDDVSSAMGGHPSAPVIPALLAIGEASGAGGAALLRAFVVGYEIEARLGTMVNPGHYNLGFHATGTLGTFGAAAAVARLLGLDAGQATHALGLAAAQAAGLKSMFGTMTKPLHAGKAAMNGLIAARLAARGFTANEEAIETFQGFAHTQVPQFRPSGGPIELGARFAIESNLFKYHAACYLTHSAIEAVRQLREHHRVGLDALESMVLKVSASHRSVCDIVDPRNGLNIKFSIRHLAAMALDGADTAALELYSDANALDPRYAAARGRVDLDTEDPHARYGAAVLMRTRDGRELRAQADVGQPGADLPAQWARLTAKTRAIAAPVIGSARTEALIEEVSRLEHAGSIAPLMRILA